jgi:threonine synthase
MDVGNPSNMERLRALYPEWQQLRSRLSADRVDDAAIAARIRTDFDRYGREWCPHTATAADAYERLPRAERQGRPWVLVATAHPAKFNEIVEPLIGKPVTVPDSLARLLQLPSRCIDAAPTLQALAAAL